MSREDFISDLLASGEYFSKDQVAEILAGECWSDIRTIVIRSLVNDFGISSEALDWEIERQRGAK